MKINWRFWRKPQPIPTPKPKSDFSFVLDDVPTSSYHFDGPQVVFEVVGKGTTKTISVMHKDVKLVTLKIHNHMPVQSGDQVKIDLLWFFKNLIDLNNWHKRTFA